LRHPERVESVVVGGAFGTLDRETARAKVAALVGGAEEHGMVEWARLYVESTVISPDPGARAIVGDALRSVSLEAYAAMTRTCFQPRSGDLTRLESPVLVLWGSEDAKTPRSMSDDLISLLPSSTLIVVDGVGHLPQVDAPDVFARYVLTYILGGTDGA
jgi:3-oxoadipate enol-lactonase